MAAWLNLIGNVVIIATGGAVRLTASGLGCDQWPLCTTTSLVPGVDEGVHGIIEFGNRLMSPVLGIFAIFAVLMVWRLQVMPRRVWLLLGSTLVVALFGGILLAVGASAWLAIAFLGVAAVVLLAVGVWAAISMGSSWRRPATRRDLWAHAWILVGGILIQALVGGITVWTGLNAWVVGSHYLASAALVGVAMSFLLRASREPGARERAVPRFVAIATHVSSLLLVLVVVGGVVTTANGPHSGDASVIRDSSAWDAFVHVHSWLGYALCAVLVVLLVGGFMARARRYVFAVMLLMLTVAVQIVVGVIQARIGIPPVLVGIHMVLAGVSVAFGVLTVDRLKSPAVGSAATPARHGRRK